MKVVTFLSILLVVLAVVDLTSAQYDYPDESPLFRRGHRRHGWGRRLPLPPPDDADDGADVDDGDGGNDDVTPEAKETPDPPAEPPAYVEATTEDCAELIGAGGPVTTPKPVGLVGKVVRFWTRLYMLLRLLMDQLMGD